MEEIFRRLFVFLSRSTDSRKISVYTSVVLIMYFFWFGTRISRLGFFCEICFGRVLITLGFGQEFEVNLYLPLVFVKFIC